MAKFTPYSGQNAIIIDEIGMHFIDMKTGKERLQIVKSGIVAMDFSPKDTYLITCEKYQQGEKNLIIWNTNTGKELTSFEWKKTSKEGPKSIKFMKDEKLFVRLSKQNTIEVYESEKFNQPKYTIIANEELLAKKNKGKEEEKSKQK